jgi:hypothetical protein
MIWKLTLWLLYIMTVVLNMAVMLKAQYECAWENRILYDIFQVVFRFTWTLLTAWCFCFPREVTKQMQLDGCLVLDILINMSCCELWFEHHRSYRNIIRSETGNLSHVLLYICYFLLLWTQMNVMNGLTHLMFPCNYWLLQHKLCTI